MSAKSSNKKNDTNKIIPWYYCGLCDIHISHKERENHDTKCPIRMADDSFTTNSMEYIYKNVLYTMTMEERKFEIALIKDLPEHIVKQLVFISEGVMRLCGWHIGQSIMIKSVCSNEAPIVRTLWPISDKFLTTVLVNREDHKFYCSPKNGNVYEVKAIPKGQPYLCSRMSLVLLNDDLKKCENEHLNQIQLRDLTRLLKRYLNNRCFAPGTRIHYNFFNKNLLLEIQEMLPDNLSTGMKLENKFTTLTVQDVSIFKINYTTSLEIFEGELNKREEEETMSNEYLIKCEDIGGLKLQLVLIEESLDFAIGLRAAPKGVKVSRGLLLYGPSGCGKTLICEAMCNRLVQQLKQNSNTTIRPLILKVNTGELFSKFLGESEKKLYSYFQQVYTHYPSPTLIIVEDIQSLCPKNENSEVVKRVSSAFIKFLDDLNNKAQGQRCFVLATTMHLDLINANLRRAGRLDIELEISPPTSNDRKEIFQCLLKRVHHELQETDIESLAQITHAFVGADLANLIYNASLKAVKRCSLSSQLTLTIDDLKDSLNTIKPSAMREVLIECPNVKWLDIGGQDNLKVLLQQAIDWPFKHAEQFKKLGIKPPRGILMYGPPGCSKTMIAKAIATESHLNFLSIKGPELFSMWVGESERAIREVFRKARQVAPAIVFFDEIDAIGSERTNESGSGTSVKERVLTQLLTELDGVESLQNVTIIAATNRPDMIDKALLRPGRFDRIIYVGLPNELARRDIFNIKLKKIPLGNDVNIEQLVERTEGYTGAEIQAICHEASLKALEENFGATQVCWPQFEYALQVVQPRTTMDLLQLYENYGKKCE